MVQNDSNIHMFFVCLGNVSNVKENFIICAIGIYSTLQYRIFLLFIA